MAGYGTGYPHMLLCPKCGEFAEQMRRAGQRPLRAQQRGKGNPRALQYQVGYVCACGHRGWTRHIDALRIPDREHSSSATANAPACGGES